MDESPPCEAPAADEGGASSRRKFSVPQRPVQAAKAAVAVASAAKDNIKEKAKDASAAGANAARASVAVAAKAKTAVSEKGKSVKDGVKVRASAAKTAWLPSHSAPRR